MSDTEIELDLRLLNIDFSLNLLERVLSKIEEITLEFSYACENKEVLQDLESPGKAEQAEQADSHEDITDPRLASFDGTGIRKLYYNIARELHPDTNKDSNKEQTDLLDEASLFYKRKDLARLIKCAKKAKIYNIKKYIGERDLPLLDYNLEKIKESINEATSSPLWNLSKKSPEERKSFMENFWKTRASAINSL